MGKMTLPEQQELLKAVLFELKIFRRLDRILFQAFLRDKSFRGEILEPIEAVVKLQPWNDKLRQVLASLRRASRGSQSDAYKTITGQHFKQTMGMFEDLVDWGPTDNDLANERVVVIREQLQHLPETDWTKSRIALGVGGSLILGLAAYKFIRKQK